MLILLTGPVGGGKSTTAVSVARELRARGRRAAVIDLDTIYPMAQQDEPIYSDIPTWQTTYRAAGAIASSFFESAIEDVVVEGGFFNDEELNWFRAGLRPERSITIVALEVSWDGTRRRVEADPAEDRVATRNVDILKWHHDRFTDALPFLHQNAIVINGESGTADDVAQQIVETLESD